MSKQSTPNTQLARLFGRTIIPNPGSFVALIEVIGVLQSSLYVLSVRMTIFLRDPAPDHKPPQIKAKRKTSICALRLDRGACATRAEQSIALSGSTVPGKIKLLSISDKTWPGTRPQGMAYWERLHQIIRKERVNERDCFLAVLASLGIGQGKFFQPTDEQRKALEQGAQAGEKIANADIFAMRALTAESPSKPLMSATQANPIDRETMKINDAENTNISGR